MTGWCDEHVGVAEASPRLPAFVAGLVSIYPDLSVEDEEDDDDSPWSAAQSGTVFPAIPSTL